LSARRSRIYTLNQYYSAIRIDEFKGVATGEIEDGVVKKGDIGGFSGSISPTPAAPSSSTSIPTRRKM
jgi:hypothetical protein